MKTASLGCLVPGMDLIHRPARLALEGAGGNVTITNGLAINTAMKFYLINQ